MKLYFNDKYQYNIPMLMRKCNYKQIKNKEGEISYVRVFGPGGYPRFHCYVVDTDKGFQVNLHLDQKKQSYGDNTAHSGDYDGDVVDGEGRRIAGIIYGLRV